MNFDLELFHNIIFLGLHPKKNHTKKDAFFKDQLLKIKKEYYQFQTVYQVDFEEPITQKRKYYVALIKNEAIKYLNTVYTEFKNAVTTNERKYLFNSFSKIVTQKLKEIHTHCTKEGYKYTNLVEGIEDENFEDEVYIIQFLKTELIRIYLEIDEKFSEYNTGDSLNEEQIYKHFFKEKQPSPSLLIEAEQIKNASPSISIKEDKKQDVFNVIKGEIREPVKGILSYETIIKNPHYFAIFEEQLFAQEYINKDYIFNASVHGLKNNLACIYATLIKKGYFNKKDFKKRKEIKPIDIRKFLDNRYQSNIDKQFRTYQNNPKLVTDFIANTFWVEKLPTL
jgi:hypothetical protein